VTVLLPVLSTSVTIPIVMLAVILALCRDTFDLRHSLQILHITGTNWRDTAPSLGFPKVGRCWYC
jgi:hypothetical protein